ncbi:MAG: sigma-70 family RNA polymerase sigma factor [Candidatus Azobacteroides sp.]|nr:sigma-70 family RNA polymerase sigma factor [Candidatus Azobacteroides sp.]
MEIFNDLIYIDRIQSGDYRAFSAIVTHYRQMVFTLVIKIVGNREEAEDVTQEIFIKVFKSIDRFKKDSKFSTWLYRIAYNTTLSELRKRKFEFVSFEENPKNLQEAELNDDIDNLNKEERIQYLELAIKKLSPDETLLISLFYLNNQSMEEISRIANLTVANVKVKLHRIRKKLAVEINKLMDE